MHPIHTSDPHLGPPSGSLSEPPQQTPHIPSHPERTFSHPHKRTLLTKGWSFDAHRPNTDPPSRGQRQTHTGGFITRPQNAGAALHAPSTHPTGNGEPRHMGALTSYALLPRLPPPVKIPPPSGRCRGPRWGGGSFSAPVSPPMLLSQVSVCPASPSLGNIHWGSLPGGGGRPRSCSGRACTLLAGGSTCGACSTCSTGGARRGSAGGAALPSPSHSTMGPYLHPFPRSTTWCSTSRTAHVPPPTRTACS